MNFQPEINIKKKKKKLFYERLLGVERVISNSFQVYACMYIQYMYCTYVKYIHNYN